MQVQDIDAEKVIDFVHRHPLGVLSTLSESRELSSAAVYTWCDTSLNFYFSTKTNTEKYINILGYGQAALTIVDPRTLETVQITGRASKVVDLRQTAEAIETFRKIVARESSMWATPAAQITQGVLENTVAHWIPPIAQISGGEYMLVKIEPHKLRYRKYESSVPGGEGYVEISAQA